MKALALLKHRLARTLESGETVSVEHLGGSYYLAEIDHVRRERLNFLVEFDGDPHESLRGFRLPASGLVVDAYEA